MRSRGIYITLAAVLLAFSARAEDVVYGPDGAPTVVQRKLYTMTGRWEVGLAGTAALNTSLVDQFGGLLSVGYHPNEWLDLGFDGLGDFTRLSSLTDEIRSHLRARSKDRPKDEFANASQLRAAGFGSARLAPLYGKLNIASELSVHFQAYAVLGAGAGFVHHESVNLCAQAGTTACPDGSFQTSDAVKPMGEVGGGFRFYLSQSWSLRTEVRAFLFADTYKEANDLTNPASGTPRTYLGTIVMVLAGVSRTF